MDVSHVKITRRMLYTIGLARPLFRLRERERSWASAGLDTLIVHGADLRERERSWARERVRL